MSKILVVYYSLDGNTQYAADQIQDITGADLEQLIPEKEPTRKGFRKYAEGGFTALVHYKPRIRKLKHDRSGPAPPLRPWKLSSTRNLSQASSSSSAPAQHPEKRTR